MHKETLTKLGLYLAKKSVNRADVSRKTKISTDRLSKLSIDQKSHLRVEELYLIALAIDADPCELLNNVCAELSLPKDKG